MASPRRRPRVVRGSALGRLLLLLSALAPGRASPRLLDFPAPVCAQEVRTKPRGAECAGGPSGRWRGGRCGGLGGPDSGGPGRAESPPWELGGGPGVGATRGRTDSNPESAVAVRPAEGEGFLGKLRGSWEAVLQLYQAQPPQPGLRGPHRLGGAGEPGAQGNSNRMWPGRPRRAQTYSPFPLSTTTCVPELRTSELSEHVWKSANG